MSDTLGDKLQEWGHQVIHHDPAIPADLQGQSVSAVMVDVRRHVTEALNQLKRIRNEIPFAETILINVDGNISASIAGMQAGAGDEITVPFDMKALRKMVNTACQRSRKRQNKKKHRSLFEFIEKSMKAAAFAEAGEFETAIDLMDTPPEAKTGDGNQKPEHNEQPEAIPTNNPEVRK